MIVTDTEVMKIWKKESKQLGMFGRRLLEQQQPLRLRVLVLLGNLRYDEDAGGSQTVEPT